MGSVLAPYRSFGLGRALLSNALSSALHPTAPPPPVPSSTQTNTRSSLVAVPPRKKINRAMAHVQVGNDDAKRFYEGLGFKEDKVYVRLSSPFFLVKPIREMRSS